MTDCQDADCATDAACISGADVWDAKCSACHGTTSADPSKKCGTADDIAKAIADNIGCMGIVSLTVSLTGDELTALAEFLGSFPQCTTESQHPGDPCGDGLDNDLDGLTDCDDPECCPIGLCSCFETACNNGIDDDFDGLTDCQDFDCIAGVPPVIETVRPRRLEPGRILRIRGSGFGFGQGGKLNINNRVFESGHMRVKLWSDTLIKIRIPKYKCNWFKGRDERVRQVTVTADCVTSYPKRFRVIKPGTCP